MQIKKCNDIENLLILLAGDPKTGKTVSAATFPKPMLFADFDGGTTSIRFTCSKSGSLIVPDWDQIDVLDFRNEDVYDLSFETAKRVAGGAPPPIKTDHPERVVGKIQEFNDMMKQLKVDGCYEGNGPYQTLVVDSLTVLFDAWKDMIKVMNKIGELRQQDYGTLEAILFSQFYPNLRSINEKVPYIILVDHITTTKGDLDHVVSEHPIGPSKNQGRLMSRVFDEVYLQSMDKTGPVWNTINKGRFVGAGSRLNMPDEIRPATYQTLEGILNRRK